VSGDIDPRRLEEDIRSELIQLLDGRSVGGLIAIERLEIGPLEADAGAGDLARAIAERVADAIRGGAHGKTQTQDPSA
jgi:hypothetical protein